MLEEIRKMKEAARKSEIRRYENGYEAHWIDLHPHGSYYRDLHNPSGCVAFPEETIMLLNSTWVVVMFLEKIDDLDRIEREMNLKRVYLPTEIDGGEGT